MKETLTNYLIGISTETLLIQKFLNKHLPNYYDQVHSISFVVREDDRYKIEIILKKGSSNSDECDSFGILERVEKLIRLCGYNGSGCGVSVVKIA